MGLTWRRIPVGTHCLARLCGLWPELGVSSDCGQVGLSWWIGLAHCAFSDVSGLCSCLSNAEQVRSGLFAAVTCSGIHCRPELTCSRAWVSLDTPHYLSSVGTECHVFHFFLPDNAQQADADSFVQRTACRSKRRVHKGSTTFRHCSLCCLPLQARGTRVFPPHLCCSSERASLGAPNLQFSSRMRLITHNMMFCNVKVSCTARRGVHSISAGGARFPRAGLRRDGKHGV